MTQLPEWTEVDDHFELGDARAERFNDVLKAPLFEQIGQPLDGDSVIRAKTLRQLERALDSNDGFWTEQAYHHTGMILEIYGWDWFQENNNNCVEAVQAEIDKTKLATRIDDAWAQADLPEILRGYSNTKQWANNWFRTISYGDQANRRRSFTIWYILPTARLCHDTLSDDGLVDESSKPHSGVDGEWSSHGY